VLRHVQELRTSDENFGIPDGIEGHVGLTVRPGIEAVASLLVNVTCHVTALHVDYGVISKSVG
jgi:hypothetical protein